MRQIKTNFIKFAAVFVAAFIVALMFSFLPRAFADQDYFVATGAEIDYDAEERTATVTLKAARAFTLHGIEGYFAVGDVGTALLTEMTPAESLSDVMMNYVSNGKFYWKDAETGVEFAEGDVIWEATYTVADELAIGTYDVPILLDVFSFGATSTYDDDETVAATIKVLGDLPDQELAFSTPSIEKDWGDSDFSVPVSHPVGDGEVTYSSTDEDVATVNPNTGIVTIVGVGDASIVAKAAATDNYAETTASYELTVNKKTVNITGVEISDKNYDGTAMIVPDNVTFDVDNLTYLATAEFEDANVGTNKDVTVTVVLTGDSNAHYALNDNTYDTTATINPLTLTAENVILPEEPIYYSGSANEPEVIVMVQLEGADIVLTENTDYTVEYSEDTVSAGTKHVYINAIGNYSGEDIDKTYDVLPYTLNNSDIDLEYTIVRYDGTSKTPEVTVTIGEFEVDDSEYTVDYGDDNVNPGPVTVTVTAKANKNIAGTATAGFEIVDKEILAIAGISNQDVAYTGAPVVLEGTLAVGANNDGIKVSDLTTTWYAFDGTTEIDRPVAVGSYVVVYSYSGPNYAGSLKVNFNIVRAVSPNPVELAANFRVEAGTELSEIAGIRTEGFEWTTPTSVVAAGAHNYSATYTYNNDTTNYTTLNLAIPVYGLSRIVVVANVEGTGGTILAPAAALEDDLLEFEFAPEEGYEIDKVLLNSVDVTGAVEDNMLTVTAGATDLGLVVKYRVISYAEEDDEVIAVPDTGFFTAATNAKIAGFTAIAVTLVGLTVVFKKKFARSKIDFDQK